jgi:hypothetical protein
MKRRRSWLALAGLLALALSSPPGSVVRADGPADNRPDSVRPVPPPGIRLSEADRKALGDGLATLNAELSTLRKRSDALPHLPDVEIFQRAVDMALAHDELFEAADVDRARTLLAAGLERARALGKGETPWLGKAGPVALGYVSRLDGSVQPYGLWLPAGHSPARRYRLDTWFHGRGEKLSEVNFIAAVSKDGGPFTRPDAVVIQPYGRYCNGSKFAGEVDFFEALADVRRRLAIDDDRIVVRGFSLGGATTWHLAAHFASDWAAAAPGAGFSETAEFLDVFQKEKLTPSWWEQKLWQLYDAPAYAENFRNVPVVAYSGERDRQKQAADVMQRALASVGLELTHVIGPGTEHKYHPASIEEINERIDALATLGRPALPRKVWLTTPTLRYNRQAWVSVQGLGKHWDKALVEAELVGDAEVKASTKNVTALAFTMPPGRAPFRPGARPAVIIDGQRLAGPPMASDRSWRASYWREAGRWQAGAPAEAELRKRPGLQGPIDDAFMSSFLVVTPSGPAMHPQPRAWTEGEQARAIKEWRRHFRGEARVKRDVDVSADDLVNHNLVLWGDPASNRVLASAIQHLPVAWTRERITVGKQSFPSDGHALVLIYPNPLNPRRYVVLNSGFTFREYDYLNNARQVPKLPDWAVVDLSTPPGTRSPGRIAAAGFFGERWEVLEPRAADAPDARKVASSP